MYLGLREKNTEGSGVNVGFTSAGPSHDVYLQVPNFRICSRTGITNLGHLLVIRVSFPQDSRTEMSGMYMERQVRRQLMQLRPAGNTVAMQLPRAEDSRCARLGTPLHHASKCSGRSVHGEASMAQCWASFAEPCNEGTGEGQTTKEE